MRRASACLVVVCCIARSGGALAQERAALDSDAILRARAALEDLRYEDAIAAVAPLTSAADGRRRVQALEITALAHLILGQPVEGQAALARLYALAPGFVLTDPSLPPRVTSAFDAEAARSHPRGVTPTLRSAGSDRSGFEIVAGGDVDRVDLSCRAATAEGFAPVATSRSASSHRFRLPAPRPYRCFAVALDKDGLPLGWLGSRRAPFEVRPRPETPGPPPATPITGRWWFWTGLGVLVTGGAALAIVVTRPAPEPPAADITVTPSSAVSW